jgi:hypothetical protein
LLSVISYQHLNQQQSKTAKQRKAKQSKTKQNKHPIFQILDSYYKMDSDLKYLLSLQAVRDQASKVFESAKRGQLKHFEYDEGRMGEVADYVSKVIDVSML